MSYTSWIQFPGFSKPFIWYHNISAPSPSLSGWLFHGSLCFHSAALTKTGEIITAGPKLRVCLSPVISTKPTGGDRVTGRGGRSRLFWKREANDIISKSTIQSVRRLVVNRQQSELNVRDLWNIIMRVLSVWTRVCLEDRCLISLSLSFHPLTHY